MSQYENNRKTGSGRSRAKGSSAARSTGTRSTGTRSTGTRSSAARSTSYRSSSQRSGSGRNSSSRNHGQSGGGSNYLKLAVGGIVLILAIACIVFLVKGMTGKKEEETTVTETETETELQKEVSVDGINITGLSREDAKAAILKEYTWDMKVVWGDKTCEVADLMASRVDALLEEIYTGEPAETYTLDVDGLEDAVTAEAARVAAQWDVKAKNGSISSYDANSDSFVFTGAEEGRAVDQAKLIADMTGALKDRDFDAVIQASVVSVEPEFSEAAAKEKYKTLGSFTTNTTANSKRNTNIKLAANAINGLVLQPGEEFSFNDRVGERTEAKGYQGAAAYNNGEVVQEIGGGVCQVSSTMYNAVLKAGLKTTVRRSHTYEPSYVTPGTDATVSWGGPDYKFVNNSSAAIGIRASYYNQTVTVSIYGVPVLEDGVSYSLKSEKLKDIDPPAPTYEEDPTLEPGVEKTVSAGTKGSQWETRLVITKNGEVISQDVDHTVTYKGHAPVIGRNTSGTMAATDPSESTIETIADPNASTGASDGESSGAVLEGPGGGPGTPATQSTTEGNGTVSAPGGSAVTETPGATTAAPTTAATAAPAPGSDTSAPTASGNEGAIVVPPMPGA